MGPGGTVKELLPEVVIPEDYAGKCTHALTTNAADDSLITFVVCVCVCVFRATHIFSHFVH